MARRSGRTPAQIDHSQPESAFGNAGLFGCLDTIDDVDVVRALSLTAEDWLRQQGKTRAVGPCLLSMNEEAGLLVAGQDQPPLIMVPWHPAYLAPLIEACGYAGCRDLHYWRLDGLERQMQRLQQRRRLSTSHQDLTIRTLRMNALAEDVEIIRTIYNDAWKDNWGFVPLTEEDLKGISSDMRPFVKPEAGMIAERAGVPVGTAMILPNLFEVTADLGANPSLLGWCKLGWRMLFHRFRTGRVILLGVKSELRYSVGGAVLVSNMIDEIIRRYSNYKADWIEAGWVLDNNRPLQKVLEHFQFQISRTIRLYDKQLGIPAKRAEELA